MNKTHVQINTCHILRDAIIEACTKGSIVLKEKQTVADKSYKAVQWEFGQNKEGEIKQNQQK